LSLQAGFFPSAKSTTPFADRVLMGLGSDDSNDDADDDDDADGG
jgi:hypothetical protein